TDEVLWFDEPLVKMAAANPKFAPIVAALQEIIPVERASIGEERLQWLKELPLAYHDQSFSLVHAGPNDCWRASLPNASDDELRTTYASLGAHTVIYGHIHQPYVRRLQGLIVANSGSVSQSYDGDRRASYLVMEGESITIRRVEYDVESEAR